MSGHRMTLYLRAFLLVLVMAMAVGKAAAQLPWPVEPTNGDHPIGNCFGEFQQYAGAPYLHPGIDIREDCAATGPWVRSVTGGTLTLTDNAFDPTSRYNGVRIVTGTTTYIYWHLDHNTIENSVRTADTNGTVFPVNTRISQIVDWTAALGNFHHLHFAIQRGGNYINPFSDPTTGGLTPEADNPPPHVDEEILICRNNSNTFLPKPATGCWVVDGDLDIIARASDTDSPLPAIAWQGNIGIYRVEYSIRELTGTSTHNIPATQLYRFDTFPTLGNGSAEAAIIYKNTSPANSESDYWAINGEQSYYLVTNVDSNGDLSEANGYWDTDGGIFPDGLYQISVTSYDFVGNHHTASKIVFVRNNPASPSPVEVFIRDRSGDTGSIPSNPNGEACWVSPDIRIDAPPLGIVNATGLPFGPNDHDNPIYNQQNRAYVRVHNLGCTTSGQVRIRLYWADPAGGIPPADWNEIAPALNKFVNNIPSGGSVGYSPPILWTPTGTAIGHRCLLVRLESTEDPIVNDYNVRGENNIGMKNVTIVSPTPGVPSASEFFITNPSKKPADVHLTIDRSNFPEKGQLMIRLPYNSRLFKILNGLEGVSIKFKKDLMQVGIWSNIVTLHGFFLSPGERILARVFLIVPDEMDVKKTYRVDITQMVHGSVTGGLRFEVPGRCQKS